MSFGSLSGPAIEALNRGAAIAGCLQNTGEGAISPYHDNGGELVWQIGTGYFGCRDTAGRFSLNQLTDKVQQYNVRAIEIKLSQGAKPGVGGFLPASKITEEIARIRGIQMGRDCASPAAHREFCDVDSMLDFVEQIADATGLPVGIKSAVGESAFWTELASEMANGHRGVDFITVDGGEGGTGAAPLVFADHVALPFKFAMNNVYQEFDKRGLAEEIVFVGSGKLGFPESGLLAFGLGCDMINVAREAMMSIGCIQAQRCHTGHCPAGIATQNKWLMRGLDPTLKSARLANYLVSLRKELLRLSYACGVKHPSDISIDQFDFLDNQQRAIPAREVFTGRAPQHTSLDSRPAHVVTA
jgi:glutamate synthase (ferredoxin)